MTVLSEEWRPIPGYGNRYEASSLGRIRRVGIGRNGRPGGVLSPGLGGQKRRPYLQVGLLHDGKRTTKLVHVLVMLAFHGPPPQGHEVDHLDNDSMNPRLDNLEYVTRSEQQKRCYRRDGRAPSNKGGELAFTAKLTWDQVREIRRRLAAKEISGRALARELGLSQGAITDIATGRNWKEAPRGSLI